MIMKGKTFELNIVKLCRFCYGFLCVCVCSFVSNLLETRASILGLVDILELRNVKLVKIKNIKENVSYF